MRIRIVGPGAFVALDQEPDVGADYFLDDATTGSAAQNRAFHALISEYYRAGAHSRASTNFDDFRNQIKKSLGAGFEAFVYVEDGKILDAKTLEDVPKRIRDAPDFRQLIRGRLKSWGDYTKTERRETLDRLIAEMIEAGVNTRKFREIMEGMDGA